MKGKKKNPSAPMVSLLSVYPLVLQPKQLSLPNIPAPTPKRIIKTLAEIEREAIIDAVEKLGKKNAHAALGISRTKLYRKLEEYRHTAFMACTTASTALTVFAKKPSASVGLASKKMDTI